MSQKTVRERTLELKGNISEKLNDDLVKVRSIKEELTRQRRKVKEAQESLELAEKRARQQIDWLLQPWERYLQTASVRSMEVGQGKVWLKAFPPELVIDDEERLKEWAVRNNPGNFFKLQEEKLIRNAVKAYCAAKGIVPPGTHISDPDDKFYYKI